VSYTHNILVKIEEISCKKLVEKVLVLLTVFCRFKPKTRRRWHAITHACTMPARLTALPLELLGTANRYEKKRIDCICMAFYALSLMLLCLLY